MAQGLWSGRYAELQTDSDGRPAHQSGIPPAQFKDAIAKDHPEFSTMRQQDAFDFLLHLCKQIDIADRSAHGSAMSPTSVFDFKTEERLQCLGCNKVRYKTQKSSSISLPIVKRTADNGATSEGTTDPVPIIDCLDNMAAEEQIDGYHCPSCAKPTTAAKTTRFVSFPKILAVQMRRFELVNWVPEKINDPVHVPLNTLDFAAYRAHGIQPGEELLPESADENAAQPPQQQQPVDEEVVAQLESMGFPRVRCVKAVRSTGNTGPDTAMNWIFEHMDDPTIDDPEPQQPLSQPPQSAADPEAVQQLMLMGFPQDRVERALGAAAGDPNRALDRLLNMADDDDDGGDENANSPSSAPNTDDSESNTRYELTGFVLHKGTSVHCGHYIASIRSGLSAADCKWFMFNDARVAAQDAPQPEQAYVYFFTRSDD
ncbi:ubiquitin C-terminal hydrolase Ubp14 [Coemansia sp. RSA 1933]|nr:ubiquitin C-terminal hydrolase Ubp14 [Coemansia sp. RSA 1933]